MARVVLPHKLLRNNKGMALIMAISALVLIMYLAVEVSYDSNVEYLVNANSLNRLKAYYAARAGVDISLLRIKTYQQAQQFAKNLGSNADMVNEIWKMPFAWPMPAPPEMSGMEKDALQKITKDSFLDASYVVTIEDEGSKIDLGDLASPAKALADNAHDRLMQIFQNKVKTDENFQKKYGSYRFDELINAIADWQTSKNASLNGGDKKAPYRDYPEGFPPNRAFRTLEEVRLVPGMNEDFYELLEPAITIYGMKGINPNQATKEVLKSLDPTITDEIASAVISRRDDPNQGSFKSKDDFWGFVQQKGAHPSQAAEQIPLVFDKVMNFRIRSTGEFASSSREIVAIVMDVQGVAASVKDALSKQQAAQNTNNTPGTNTNPNQNSTTQPQAQSQNAPLPKGPPRIVYWSER